METTAQLEKKFAKMGAEVRFGTRPRRSNITLDIRKDKKNKSFFDIEANPASGLEYQILDVRPDLRHLLLLVKEPTGKPHEEPTKHKFLCGHDERDWFVAAVPGNPSTVLTAFEALKPKEVIDAQAKKKVSGMRATRRKNSAYIRQGEWFFLPAPDHKVDPKDQIRKNERLSRGTGSKPHVVQEAHRTGGSVRWVCARYPQGVTESMYKNLLKTTPEAKTWRWTSMMLDAEVYVRGTVRHSDHATIYLHGWHKVLMNTESKSASGQKVVFLD